MNGAIRHNPQNAAAIYTAESHTTLCGEMMDVQMKVGELMSVCAQILDGKSIGTLEAVEVSVERLLIEAEDLVRKMRDAQPQTVLFAPLDGSRK